MKNWFSLFLILFAFAPLQAHQADVSSTMLVEQENNTWLLNIRAAFTAFEYEIHTHYSDSAYASPEEFNQLVIDYFQDHVIILANDHDTAFLSNPVMKLGHESSLIFEVTGIPATILSIQVRNTAFQDIYHSQSALIILKKGMKKDQFTLNEKNQYAARLEIQDNHFLLDAEQTLNSPASLIYWIVAGILMILSIFVLLRINKVARTT